ncbi:MAG TPA: DinB family protein [Candidatus Eisenbacteria bacterium]
MTFTLDRTIALLECTPSALAALLGGLPGEWTRSNEGAGTFSPYDVVGHLIHGEQTDWIVRARIILEQGEARPFDRFDRFAQSQEGAGRGLGELLAEFAARRAENLATLRSWNLGPGELARRGTHPVLGPVTLRQLLATWAVHDLTHLHQISRVMAHQYRGEVGPWDAFLGVLRCEGHSAPA